jgi:hypothetical protein
MVLRVKLVPRGADLIGMGSLQHGRGCPVRAVVVEALQLHIGPLAQNLGKDAVGQVFDVENALGIDGHA